MELRCVHQWEVLLDLSRFVLLDRQRGHPVEGVFNTEALLIGLDLFLSFSSKPVAILLESRPSGGDARKFICTSG